MTSKASASGAKAEAKRSLRVGVIGAGDQRKGAGGSIQSEAARVHGVVRRQQKAEG